MWQVKPLDKKGKGWLWSGAVVSLLAGLLLGTPALAQQSKVESKGASAEKVKVAVKAGQPDAAGKQLLTITLNIAKGWHLYANSVGYADLEGARTVVEIQAAVKPQAVKILYPPGKVHTDPDLKNPDGSPVRYRVYEEQVTIQAQVQRAAGDQGPLQVTVHVQACDARRCLPPGTIRLTVP